ncbi:Di-/tripeptide transporter [Granulibacter bethesdensis]|uniref:Di-/tripeptide transporter n=1 Tax=Granulibacter bethesdensis (strain ATCC BAA-1260 / CGDNIH1) TaxID=391165 RepID=Q0BQZ3_GRABC|nr:Di-/tripeptide transporter [Granulibacter bethesdensis CGDNIH1]AHJ68294.1 Di-/tripeptide transporter [Granulibacter bethesdensis]APH52621.1 Di-/tripeptide transporter [Granulibacter bethesdensis]APH65310.1 Di-/tripeptide transporter [Granulibacter bethesdensis]
MSCHATDCRSAIVNTPLTQPDNRTRAFIAVLSIELWERFGYYAMQAILLLFLIQKLHFSSHDAVLLAGAFAASVYATPVLGGWLGDRVLGARRCTLSGAVILTAGYSLLGLPTAWSDPVLDETSLAFAALGMISVGNGLFKPNAAALVRVIHEGQDQRLDAAFTLYYMAVNVGSSVSMLLTPWVQQQAGWHSAFAVSFFGLALGIAGYGMMRSSLGRTGTEKDHHPVPLSHLLAVSAGCAFLIIGIALLLHSASLAMWCNMAAALGVLMLWSICYGRAAPEERPGLAIMYALAGQSLMFFIFYQQMSTSLTLFTVHGVSPALRLGGHTLMTWTPAQFQALDPIWIMLLGPVLAGLYTVLARRGRDVRIAAKFTAGFVSVGTAFLIWWGAARIAGPDRLVSPWIMVAGYGALALGELLIGGLGLAMVARYVPKRLNSLMMGSYLLTMGLSMYAGSRIAGIATSSFSSQTAQTPAAFVSLFGGLSVAAFLAALVCLTMAPWLRRLDRQHRAFALPGPAPHISS